jgi:hypothetical protein
MLLKYLACKNIFLTGYCISTFLPYKRNSRVVDSGRKEGENEMLHSHCRGLKSVYVMNDVFSMTIIRDVARGVQPLRFQ